MRKSGGILTYNYNWISAFFFVGTHCCEMLSTFHNRLHFKHPLLDDWITYSWSNCYVFPVGAFLSFTVLTILFFHFFLWFPFFQFFFSFIITYFFWDIFIDQNISTWWGKSCAIFRLKTCINSFSKYLQQNCIIDCIANENAGIY